MPYAYKKVAVRLHPDNVITFDEMLSEIHARTQRRVTNKHLIDAIFSLASRDGQFAEKIKKEAATKLAKKLKS